MGVLAPLKDAAAVAAAFISSVTFIFAVFQYRSAQTWKRNEFLAKEMKEFLGDDKVKEAFRFFDYWGSSFSVKIDGSDQDIRVFHTAEQIAEYGDINSVNCVSLTSALQSGKDAIFSSQETIVRDYIDNYFGYLERICAFRKNRLFKTKEVMPFIRYHVDNLNGLKEHSTGYQSILFSFLVKYDYNLTIDLLSSFPQSSQSKLALERALEARSHKMVLQARSLDAKIM